MTSLLAEDAAATAGVAAGVFTVLHCDITISRLSMGILDTAHEWKVERVGNSLTIRALSMVIRHVMGGVIY
jgi:hypothetical protein